MLVFFLFASLLANSFYLTQAQNECSDGYVFYEEDGTCIKAYVDRKRMRDAMTRCRKEGGSLVKINSDDKNRFVTGLISTEGKFWLDLKRNNWRSDYYTSDGEKSVYENFLGATPHRRSGCVVIDGERGNWSGYFCMRSANYVCEREEIPEEEEEEVEQKRYCDEGYIFYVKEQTCIKIVNQLETWDDASSKCEAANGNLLVIDSEEENNFISEHLNSSKFYWIGVRNQEEKGLNFAYVDGDDLSYSNWRDGQPDNYANREHCVMIFGNENIYGFGGQWNDYSCHKTLRYVCEREPKVIETGICPDGWRKYKDSNSCIKIFTTRRRFNEARDVCKFKGGDLVVIRDEKKNNFVTEKFGRSLYWIGVINNNKAGGFDIKYVDGSDLGAFRPWKKGQPDNGFGKELCIMTYGTRLNRRFIGSWSDFACYVKLPFVCEMPVPS